VYISQTFVTLSIGGPARNLLDHHQEAGRAGRDGKQSDIVVIYHGQQLTHCEDEVKSFVKSTSCLRVASCSARAFFNIQAGGANAPIPPLCPPTKSHFAPPPGKVPFS
jgi:hypothetical protein